MTIRIPLNISGCLLVLLAWHFCIAAASPQKSTFRLDTISGDLPKMVAADKGPYVVVGDIMVPQGKTVIIEPGAVFLFSNFTGLKIQGTLLARGTSQKPIVFTSVNDTQYNTKSKLAPAPYDWNGIYLYEDGSGTNFSYCTIFYSVFGINSMTKYIRIGPSLFRNNGRANLTIEGAEYKTGDQPYEYALTINDAAANGALTILKDPNAFKRNMIRYGGLTVFMAGCVLGGVYSSNFATSLVAFNKVNSTDPHNLAENSQGTWRTSRDKANTDMISMIAGYTLGIIGAAGFSWSFTF